MGKKDGCCYLLFFCFFLKKKCKFLLLHQIQCCSCFGVKFASRAHLVSAWEYFPPLNEKKILSSVVTGEGGAGAECPQRLLTSAPQKLLTRKFLLNILGKKGKGVKIEKENCKREGGKLEMEEVKVIKRGEVFFFFCLSLLKFMLSLPKWEFSNGKKHFKPGKKSGKITLPPPQKNMPVMPLILSRV